MAFEPGQTAIVVPVAAADRLVDRWRQRYDPSASLGVSAHLTVLYPFLEFDIVDKPTLAGLRRIFAQQPAFELQFRRCGRFPGVLYLAPEPAGPVQVLTAAVMEQWPRAQPYGGVYAEVIPHLTVAAGVDEATLALVEADISAGLPLRTRVSEATLLGFDGGRWMVHARLPMAP